MSINSEALQRKLYDLLDNKCYNPKPMDATGKITPVPEEAAVIRFDFIKDGENYGKVWISIDGSKKLKIYYGDNVSDSPSDNTSGTPYSDSWTALINHLKNWAQRRQLSFELRNENHLEADMAQREHMDKKERVSEGYYPMGKSASYSDAVPSVKIVIEHSRKIEEGEQRYRNINRIFVENANGERFLLNTTKPGIARVYARHIAEGGTPYDDRGQHIKGIVEEYSKMAGFVRATRNGQFNESSQRLITEGINHYNSLRETLSRMSGKRGYEAYFESWTPSLMEDESDMTAVNELFVQETVDPRIESAMPILAKLSKNISEMTEVTELAEWADSLLEGGDGGEASEETDGDTASDAGEGGAEDVDDSLTEGDGGQEALNPQGIPEGDELVQEGKPSKTYLAMTYLKAVVMAPTGTPENERIRNWQEKLEDEFDIKMDTATLAQMMPQFDSMLQAGKLDKLRNRMASRGELEIGESEQEVAEVSNDTLTSYLTKLDRDNLKHKMDPTRRSDAKRMKSGPNFVKAFTKLDNRKQGVEEGMLDGSDGIDSPVASAILRRILMQRLDLLSKYGPEKVSNAIGDVADFVGDVDEIGSSDVSGWIKQVEMGLGGMAESDEPEAYDEFASDTFSDDNPEDEIDEGIIDKIKDVGQKALDTLGHGSDEDLLRDLKKRAGVRNPENGKPSMAQSDVEKVDEDEFAGDYATGEAGQWRNKGPKANKPATIGDLVGENFINTDAQAVVSEEDSEDINEAQDDLAAMMRIINR